MTADSQPSKQSILQDLQARLAELIRTSPAADVERNMKAMFGQAFDRLELVTREEFDTYVDLLSSLRARIAKLEQTVDELEARAQARPGAAAKPTAAATPKPGGRAARTSPADTPDPIPPADPKA